MNEKLLQAVQPILRGDLQIPSDFEIGFIVQADKAAVQRARDAQTLNCGEKACFLALCVPMAPACVIGIPFCCFGVPCQVRSTYTLMQGLLEDAENDVYVIGKNTGGLVNVNLTSRKVKCFSPPSENMTLLPDFSTFVKKMITPCGSSNIVQPVLWVQKSHLSGATHSYSKTCFESAETARFQAGILKDLWFVNEQDLMTLPTKLPNNAMMGGANVMVQGMMQQMMAANANNPQIGAGTVLQMNMERQEVQS